MTPPLAPDSETPCLDLTASGETFASGLASARPSFGITRTWGSVMGFLMLGTPPRTYVTDR